MEAIMLVQARQELYFYIHKLFLEISATSLLQEEPATITMVQGLGELLRFHIYTETLVSKHQCG